MGDDGDDPEGLDLADCATLLGQPWLLLWIRSKTGRFAPPAGTKNGRRFWHEDDVYRWAADGRLYPAPKDSYWGLSWGYPGSGPGSLALLISRLLDDVTARGANNATGAPDGLEKLTQIKWPRGTVFTRAQLEAARDGRPYAEE